LTNVTKMSRAEKAINEMPHGLWINSRNLAKNACLGAGTMTKYLERARKRGLVENKNVAISSSRLHLWRRKKLELMFFRARARAISA
jgi:hypothetical protein